MQNRLGQLMFTLWVKTAMDVRSVTAHTGVLYFQNCSSCLKNPSSLE